jgi:hypothetical protein
MRNKKKSVILSSKRWFSTRVPRTNSPIRMTLFDVLREVQLNSQSKLESKDVKINEIKECKSDGEAKIIKNIEIVVDVFKKAADKIGKIGERDWREVLEQQTYVLEEIISIQDNLEKGPK